MYCVSLSLRMSFFSDYGLMVNAGVKSEMVYLCKCVAMDVVVIWHQFRKSCYIHFLGQD